MAKFQLVKGEASVILTVFIQDSSKTTGEGLGSLDETSSIAGGYVQRNGAGVALVVDENVTTEGTYQAPSAVGKVRIGTVNNMPVGFYELHFHDDLFTGTGKDWLTIGLSGASNMATLAIEVQLVADDPHTTGVTLRDDSITLAKFDETTAWPLVAADSGASQVARVGADGDTLKGLSDQIDGTSTHDAAAVWSASGRALSTPSDYKADVSGLSTHSAANVWTAGSRALSTPSDYKADVSGLSTHNAAAVWLAGSRALSTPSDYMATGFSTHDAADVKTAMEVNGTKLDHLWEMTEDDGGTRRLTQASLAQAPSGGLDAAGIRTALGMSSANLDTQLGLKATVNALAGLITTVGTAGGGLTGLGGMSTTMKAQIRTQAVAALVTDTYDELGGVPADDSSIKDKIEWLFIRSKHYGTQSSSSRTVRNADSDTVIATAATSDDGSTFTREKWTS